MPSNYTDQQRNPHPTGVAPSPPYATTQREGEYRSYAQHEPSADMLQRSQGPIAPPVQQQQPPSPRKSMFDFVSPFDALSSTSTGSIKKKPVPAQPSSVSSGNEDSGSWTAVSVSDPKRQSVDNLLEALTRGQAHPPPPPPPPVSVQTIVYDSYLSGSDFSQNEQVQTRVPLPPLPPKPVPGRTGSPRASPPKTQAQRAVVPPAGHAGVPQGPVGNNRRDKESSPGPRGLRNRGVAQAKMNKNQSSPRCVKVSHSST